MGWLKIEVTVSGEAVEALSDAMHALVPSGIQVEERDGAVTLTVYPPDTVSPEDLRARIGQSLHSIKDQGLEIDPGTITIGAITDEDWAENYKKYFKPTRIGALLIKPSWEDVEPAPGELVIQLDPGMAFGTGAHPTTEGCLLFLQEVVGGGETVLDLGTGSGILAIAAAKLGAARVVAIDNDAEAVGIAQENAAVNGVAGAIDFVVGDIGALGPLRADIAVANLTAPLIIEVLPTLVHAIQGLKTIIASGITTAQKDAVVEALERNGFPVKDTRVDGEWVAMVGERG